MIYHFGDKHKKMIGEFKRTHKLNKEFCRPVIPPPLPSRRTAPPSLDE